MTAHLHTEYPDTERPGAPFVGYTDPHEQTASDDEVATIVTEPYVPIEKRWHKFRLWKDESGYWIAMQPSQVESLLFRELADGAPARAFAHWKYERVLDELRAAILKGEAAMHMKEALS